MAQPAQYVAPSSPIPFTAAFTGLANITNDIVATGNAGAQTITGDVIHVTETAYRDSVFAQPIEPVTNGAFYVSTD